MSQTTLGATRIRSTDGGDRKACDRCGRRTNRNTKRDKTPRPTVGGLILCVDCKTDKWYIERVGQVA